jgi:hypothetical protein
MVSQNPRRPDDPALRAYYAGVMSKRIGAALIVLSCVLFFVLMVVPFMPLDGEAQLVLATGLAISSEGTFWLGCLIAGRSILSRLGRRLWPARRRAPAARSDKPAPIKPSSATL